MKKQTWTKEDLQQRELLSVEQAAIYAERSIASIRQWIFQGLVPTELDDYGYRVLIKRTDIDARLNQIDNHDRRKQPRGKYNVKKNLDTVIRNKITQRSKKDR